MTTPSSCGTSAARKPAAASRSPVADATVLSVAFSPDGKTLASGSFADGTVILWDVASPSAGASPSRIAAAGC